MGGGGMGMGNVGGGGNRHRPPPTGGIPILSQPHNFNRPPGMQLSEYGCGWWEMDLILVGVGGGGGE